MGGAPCIRMHQGELPHRTHRRWRPCGPCWPAKTAKAREQAAETRRKRRKQAVSLWGRLLSMSGWAAVWAARSCMKFTRLWPPTGRQPRALAWRWPCARRKGGRCSGRGRICWRTKPGVLMALASPNLAAIRPAWLWCAAKTPRRSCALASRRRAVKCWARC